LYTADRHTLVAAVDDAGDAGVAVDDAGDTGVADPSATGEDGLGASS